MDQAIIERLIKACEFAGDAIFHGELTEQAMHECYQAAQNARDAQQRAPVTDVPAPTTQG